MINVDFSQRVGLVLDDVDWAPSPSPGVERRRLERVAAESGHTTSVVRYAEGSAFSSHVHNGGEEFLVLDGVFSDESGDYPVGTYVRNPIGSRHAPRSEGGCTIFVKLCQMSPEETQQTVVETAEGSWEKRGEGLELALYVDERERVVLRRFPATATVTPSGVELLVLEGAVAIEGERYPGHAWVRIPAGQPAAMEIEAGTTFWEKSGHLPPA